ncbi:MAG: transporter substrate-binding domain-containing protein [Methylobacteriaceae bacterium]|nr:transporter substrate-binding domain-containing protein [Methylobacteriaceae bacterium]
MRAVFAPARRLLVAAALALVLGDASVAETGDRVRIAFEGARPPWNMLDARGELAGFEVELARALCLRLALTCQFVQQDWDQLLPGLSAGSHDVVMSALTPTEERRAGVDFGAPYLRMPLAFAAARGRTPRPFDPAALAGRAVGVEQGGAQEEWIERVYKDADVRRYASLEEAMLDLAAGRIEFVAGPKDALAAFIDTRKEARCCRILGDAPRDPAYRGEAFAMAFRKTDAALRARFDKALAEALADGSYEAIRKKYFAWPIY